MNVDSYAGVHPDVAGTLTALPFRDGSVSAVYCGHVLEHLDYGRGLPAALAEIRRVLSGRLCVVGPDCDRVLTDPEWLPLAGPVRYGGDRWPGDRHLWRSTGTATLAALLPFFPEAGEVPVGDIDRDIWPLVDDPGWQFAILA